MTTLTIECSSGTGSIAVNRDGEILHNDSFENARGRGTSFFALLEKATHQIGTLDSILVGIGPGGYNPLRVSIAAAWGIARAREVPLRGICSLLGYDALEYHVLGDARAGQWFHAHIRNGRLVSPPVLLKPEEASSQLTDGIPVFTTSPLMESARCESPQAVQLAYRADQAETAAPIYLKPPHITKPAPFQ
jgi:tRNA A37 threonylcarbamoyladenosine modification protein TsaB